MGGTNLAPDESALWRAEANAALWEVSREFEQVKGNADGDEKKVVRKTIEDDLAQALQTLARPPRGKHPWERIWSARRRFTQGLRLYYSGAHIERTWSSIHHAGALLYLLYGPALLRAKADRLWALVKELPNMSDQEHRLEAIKEQLKGPVAGEDLGVVRAHLSEIYQEATDASSVLQVSARTLRNALLLASLALVLILFGLGWAHLEDNSLLSVCATSNSGIEACPAGTSARDFDVFAVELAGMLGGALSVVIPIAGGERIKTPYRVFNHQLLLKVLAGGATGLAGVMLLEGAVLSTVQINTEAAIVGYAIFFGATQQILTGMIDRQANQLADKTPTAKSV